MPRPSHNSIPALQPLWKRVAKSVLIGLVLAYGGLLFMLTFLQSKMLYFPSKTMNTTPATYQTIFEDLHFKSQDGTKLHGWWFPKKNATRTILFCHGNAGNIAGRIGFAHIYLREGWQVFLFDYRGYGKSEGTPSERGTYNDVMAAWKVLTEQKQIPPSQIIIYGKSMGGPIAAYAAAHTKPGGLVLDSTFSSFRDVAKAHFPFLPIGLIARFNYDTISFLKQKQCPVLIIHSPTDEVVPFGLGQKCFKESPEPKHFLKIRGGHNDNIMTSKPYYTKGLHNFFKHLPVQSKSPGNSTQ